MASRVLASAFLVATACTALATAAVPFSVNHTALRQRLAAPAVNSWPPAKTTRRRPREAPDQPLSPDSSPFYANYSLVGMELDCSDAAKACLAINRLLHDSSGRCYALGDDRPCNATGETLVLDMYAFRQGRIVGTCHENACNGFVMAYDGKCYSNADIDGKLCLDGSELVPHPFGGHECVRKGSKREFDFHQSSASGRCVIPSFQTKKFLQQTVQCSDEEAACLGMSLVSFEGGCHPVLTNATCPDAHWLVLDERAAINDGRLVARCELTEPCGPDAFLLREDGACHSETELRVKLCPGEKIILLPSGEFICSKDSLIFELIGVKDGPGVCQMQMISRFKPQGTSTAIVGPGVSCASNDDGKCQREVTITQPPLLFYGED